MPGNWCLFPSLNWRDTDYPNHLNFLSWKFKHFRFLFLKVTFVERSLQYIRTEEAKTPSAHTKDNFSLVCCCVVYIVPFNIKIKEFRFLTQLTRECIREEIRRPSLKPSFAFPFLFKYDKAYLKKLSKNKTQNTKKPQNKQNTPTNIPGKKTINGFWKYLISENIRLLEKT